MTATGPAGDDAPVLVHRDGALATLTLNRPAALNSIDKEMAQLWRESARELGADDTVGAVVVVGAGRAFCAGGDLLTMSDPAAADAVAETARIVSAGILALVESEKPVVAGVHGAVAGGGLGIMLAADVVVASPEAVFASRYTRVGLTPDLGVTTRLPEAVGQRRALQFLLTDMTLGADEARDWGLVAEIVDDPAARAAQIATGWIDGAIAAFGQAKRLVHTAASRSFRDSLEDEARTIGASARTPEAQTRIAAFLDAAARRTPPVRS